MINIYTDGAYAVSIDSGGWAFIVEKDNNIIFKTGDVVKHTTNNRMEIEAVLRSLFYIKYYVKENIEVNIYSDSMYVIGTLTKHWKIKKNKDLWKVMYNTIKSLKHKINFIHVKGHSDNEYNNLCDELAVFYSKIN